ncbi:MAG: methyltransferase [Bacteroidetes bacterium]|nr:methyltransferase [Bacteroidota bacterium]
MTTAPTISPSTQMMQMITGFWTSCCIYNAAKLNVADLLHKDAMSCEQLAESTRTNASSLYRMMRALASVGIFSENEKGEFANTTLSETLRSDLPGSMKAMAIAQLGDHYPAWGNLLYSLKTGNTAFEKVEGMNVWKYYETHPEEGLNFMKAMTGSTNAAIQNVIPMYDFSSAKTIVDIGGGNGVFLMAILDKAPQATGIVFDEEYVVDETIKTIEERGFSKKCSVSAGNFFEAVTEGADIYLMKHVLHDWNDEQSVQILRNCSEAMHSGSKMLVIEAVIPTGNTRHPGKFMDINMMAMTGGKERTEAEYASIFEQSGLKLARVIHTNSPTLSILEVTKA